MFEARKKTLLSERLDLEAQIASWQGGKRDAGEEVAKFIERADSACLAYKHGTVEEKRDLLDALTSNRIIDGKTPVIVLSLPFRAIAERPKSADGAQDGLPIESGSHYCHASPTFSVPIYQHRQLRRLLTDKAREHSDKCYLWVLIRRARCHGVDDPIPDNSFDG